jgi:hypothetical protein
MRSIKKKFANCPVCGYWLDVSDFNICPSCGVEFGIDTVGHTYEELREVWVDNGALWSSDVDRQPEDWNPWLQLILAGHGSAVPFVATTIHMPQPHIVSSEVSNIASRPMFVVHVR